MKRLNIFIAISIIATMMAGMSASALEYNTENSEEYQFAKSTSVDVVEIVNTAETDNINRSKDSSFLPPSFGSPSSNTPGTGELLTPNISGVPAMQIGSTIQIGNSILPDYRDVSFVTTDPVTVFIPPAPEPAVTYNPTTAFTLPDGLYYSDGSLGTLKIPKISLSVKVYEDESLESLKKGAGHFKSTSVWDGNVGLAGHNRGVANHFGQIHTLKNGDKITYTTQLGTRTYSVFYVGQIQETDYTYLGRSDENIITLITCVMNIPNLRWCVRAVEVI